MICHLSFDPLCDLQRSLPRLEEQIEEKLAQTHAELERYGNGPPLDTAERLVFLIDVSSPTLHNVYLQTIIHQYEFLFKCLLNNHKTPANNCFCCYICTAESDSIHSGCNQPDCGRGTQVWRQAQRLFYTQKRVREVECPPGPLRRKL